MPMRFVDPSSILPNASAGSSMLKTFGNMIRPQIGGSKRTKHSKRNRQRKGGFVPSVMEGFVSATSKYIAPMAMYAAYKFVNRPTKGRSAKGRKTSKRRH